MNIISERKKAREESNDSSYELVSNVKVIEDKR
jgi:hypothetical protein